MAFKNTVETVGDAALIRSIIDKSITELNCNITTSIRQQAFRACTALASVNFPNVTSVANGAFYGCTALAKADFASPVAFATYAFQNCSALTALILRSTDQLCTITDTTFVFSAIASGTGYIYVPAALVDQYKASWTAYAAQIRAIEDYLDIIDPYSWPVVAMKIADGTYASFYKVGDLVPLDMGAQGQIDMQIAGFDVDDLADGSGKAPISWISKELLITGCKWNAQKLVSNSDGTYQEGTGTIGGWEKSTLRTYLNETILPIIPTETRGLIKTVVKTQDMHDTAGNRVSCQTTDDVWVPEYDEFYSSGGIYTGLFNNAEARIKRIAAQTNPSLWWMRSSYSTGSVYCVNSTGDWTNYTNYNLAYIPLCFCT